MYENLGEAAPEQFVDQAINSLRYVCGEQALMQTTDNDPRIASFGMALGEKLLKSPNVYNAVGRMLAHRAEIDPEYAFNLLLRASHKQYLKHRIPLEPTTDPREWEKSFERFTDPEGEDYDDYMHDILEREIQSNIGQREVSTAFFRAAAVERIGEHPVRVDLACAQNIGNKIGTTGRLYRFKDVSVTPSELVLPKVAKQWPENAILSARVRWVVNKSKELLYGLGVDKWEVESAENRLWVDACSFYTSKLLNLGTGEVIESTRGTSYEEFEFTAHYGNLDFFQHKMLEQINDPKVGFYKADITTLDPEDIIKRLPEGMKPNLVTIYTVMNQLTPAQQQQAIKNALALVDPQGYILVKDFAVVDPNHNDRLVINHAGPRLTGEYRLFMIDPQNLEEGFVHLITYATGRCLQMQFQKPMGRFALAETLGLLR